MIVRWTPPTGFAHPEKPRKQEPPWNEGRWQHFSFYETERCVGFVLVALLKFVLGEDFLFQKRIPVKGIDQTGLNRSDFWVLPHGKGATYGVGGGTYSRGRIINPIASTLLIHKPNKDRFERALFRAQHYDEVFILDFMLYAAPKVMVEDALRGVDHSGR